MNLDEIERKSMIATAIAMVTSFVASIVIGVIGGVLFFTLTDANLFVENTLDWAGLGVLFLVFLSMSIFGYLVYAAVGVWRLLKVIPEGRRLWPILGLLLGPIAISLVFGILGSIPLIGIIFSLLGFSLGIVGPPLIVWAALRFSRPKVNNFDPYTTITQ